MDATNASAKGGAPLIYPNGSYTLRPGMYMYPTPPMAYAAPPPMFLPPHVAMQGHNLYFSGQHGMPGASGVTNVRNSSAYQGQPLMEGTMDYTPYMMSPMVQAYQGTPIYEPQYIPHVPSYHIPPRQAIPRSKIISIEDVTDSETEGINAQKDSKTSTSVLKSDNVTGRSGCVEIKEMKENENSLEENSCIKKDFTKSANDDKVNLSNARSEDPYNSVSTKTKIMMNDHMNSKQEEKMSDELIRNEHRSKTLSATLMSQNTEEGKPHQRTREEKSCQVQLQGVITEVHSNIGKLCLQEGKEYYFSRDLCFLYGVSLAPLELWHVLFEGQQVKVILNNINSVASEIAQVIVVEEDPDLDPDATILNLQNWCSVNNVSEEATTKLIQLVKGWTGL